jgi:predicted metal-binding membrane protein
MENTTALESVLKRDRLIVGAGLAGVAALGWAYILYLAWTVPAMDMGADAGMARMHLWGATELALAFVMWAVMMVAMMVPSATPMILTFAAINRVRRAHQRPFVSTGVFLVGYVAVWGGFSLAAALAQGGLHGASLLVPGTSSAIPYVGGALLVAAGVFQWSRLKYVCLTACRTPANFLASEWREGTGGALVMGLRHGVYCLGCCWLLMALLFVLGVMNLLWVAALAAFVLAEKVAPGGIWISRVTGVVLAAWGVWVVAG